MADLPELPAWVNTALWAEARKEGYDQPPPPKANGPNGQAEPLPDPLVLTDLSTLADQPLEPPVFLDGHGFILMDAVHVMNGDGGAGKTDLFCQLALACRTETEFLGLPVRQGEVVFYSAEEPIEKIHWRIQTICSDKGLDFAAATKGIHIIDCARKSAWLFGENSQHRMVLTPHWNELVAMIKAIKPVVWMVDNRMRVLAGNQNDTVMAVDVITRLDCLAYETTSAGLLASHPSLSQLSSGRGDAGSVSWGNAGRGRSLLAHPDKDREFGAEDDGRRVLTNLKANYGKPGRSVEFQWKNGYLNCTYVAPRADVGLGRPDRAKRVFKTRLRWFNEHNIHVHASISTPKTYAPKLFFSDKKASEGVTVSEFATAMAELLDSGEIINRAYGPKSRDQHELVLKRE